MPDEPRPVLSPSEYAARRAELAELLRVRDRDLPALRRNAERLELSDLGEELFQIDDDRARVEARISQLLALLADARIEPGGDTGAIAWFGRTVEVEFVRKGRRAAYTLGGADAPPGPRTVPASSPLGRALLGRCVGDVVQAELPGARFVALRIVHVRPAAPR